LSGITAAASARPVATAASATMVEDQTSNYLASLSVAPSDDVTYVLAVGGFNSVLTAFHVNMTSGKR
jgi:hypothetical protein